MGVLRQSDESSFWCACGAMANLQDIQVSVYSLKPNEHPRGLRAPRGRPGPRPPPRVASPRNILRIDACFRFDAVSAVVVGERRRLHATAARRI